MKCLVTGMTASQVTEQRSIAGCLARVLRSLGHDVTVARPSLERSLDGEQWDHVFVGLGPLHGIGTSMKYGALATIGSHWDRCTLYLDDVDSGKIGSGLRIMTKNPWKLTKPFYSYCREYKFAELPAVHDWLMTVVTSLVESRGDDCPGILVPGFTADDTFRTAVRVAQGIADKTVRVDWSVMMPSLSDEVGDDDMPLPVSIGQPWWAVEESPHSASVRSLGPFQWPVRQTRGRELKMALRASGFVVPGTWWTGRLYQASLAGLPVVTPWRAFSEAIGASFEALAKDVEVMIVDDRADLSERQFRELRAACPDEAELAKLCATYIRDA